MADTNLMTRPDEIAARALPANVEAEAAFLGAALIDNRVIEELNTPLRPDHYHRRWPDRQPLKKGRIGAAGLIVVTGSVERQNPAGPPDRHAPVRLHPADQLTLPIRPQSFRRTIS